MKGDFSRLTFDAANHFSRVLMQQGRVTVDADPNEQAAILLHYLRTLARDLIGPCGGPRDALGFALTYDAQANWKLTVGEGRYYVDGILCENDTPCSYAEQPDYTPSASDALLQWLDKPEAEQAFWLYLDVWERHLTWIEDDAMREVALGGPDTCTRTKVVWQVKALSLPAPAKDPNGGLDAAACGGPLSNLSGLGGGQLAADLDPGEAGDDPCVITPDARYRGLENQLYRIEIHDGGSAGTGGETEAAGAGPLEATFKWSRDNGSLVTRWLGTDGNDLLVSSGRGFAPGCWVELTDDALDLAGAPGVLVLLANVDGDRLTIDPSQVPAGASTAWTESLRNPKVRRWDETDNDATPLSHGVVPIVESTAGAPHWIDLEDGLRVRFEASADPKQPVLYRSGDYWLVAARVATGDIDWPRTTDANGVVTPDLLPPSGIEHHYAPLGWITSNADETVGVDSCLCSLQPLSPCDRPMLKPAPKPTPKPPVGPTPQPPPHKITPPKKAAAAPARHGKDKPRSSK